MKEYHKLVRDKIPQIIRQGGETPFVRALQDEEYIQHLEQKLDEEVQEYHTDKIADELADILEVVYALAAAGGYSREELLAVYQHKHDVRGGFANRIFLIGKE